MKTLVAVLLLAVVGNLVADAATISWTNTAGGNWSGATNWSPSRVPGSSDDAVITNNGSYLVTLDTSPTINSLTVGGAIGTQTLTNAGQTLTLNNASVVAANGVLAFGGGSLSGGGLLTVNGQFNWTSGSIASGSALNVATNGVLNLAGNGTFAISAPLTNAGTMNWAGTGNLQINNNSGGLTGGIVNLAGAVFNAQNDQQISNPYGNGYFNNAGLFYKSPTTGTTAIYAAFTNSSTGTVRAQSGTILFNAGGTLSGSFLTGPGAAIDFNGTLTFTGPITNFVASGVTVVGLSNLVNAGLTNCAIYDAETIAGSVNWSGGTLNSGASLMVASNGVLNLAGNGTFTISAPLTNAGTMNWAGTGNLQINNSGSLTGGIVNLAGAVFNAQNDQQISNPYGNGYFNNAGLFYKSPTTGTTAIYAAFTNSSTGTVRAQSGTILFNAGGTLSGSFLTGPGAAIDFNGTLTFTGPITNFVASGVTVVGLSNLVNAGLTNCAIYDAETIAGSVNWSGGTLNSGASLTVASNGVLNLAGNGTFTISAPLTNAGTMNWAGTGNLQIDNSGSLTGGIVNLAGAVFNAQNDQQISNPFGGGYFNNAGLLRKSPTTGNTTINVALTNTGTVNVDSGTINLNGNYTLAGGTLNIGIDSLTNYGTINLSGSPAPLSGTLSANLHDGYVPAAGNSFAVITYGSRSGYFGGLALPALATNEEWQVSYGASSALLQVVALGNGSPQITGTVTDSIGHPIPNIAVFTYAVSAPSTYLADSTDVNGHYVLLVTNGTWSVGVAGLSSLGYGTVSNQVVDVNNSNKVVNFLVECLTLQSPSNIVVSSCSPIQIFYAATFTDPCCTNVSVQFEPASGSYFSPGTVTTVQCGVSDSCGNTNSSSFTVTVNPQESFLLFNTGVDSNGLPLAVGSVDPHYSIVVNPNDASPSAFVPLSIPGSYTPNSAISQWISPTTNGSDSVPGPAVYHYQTTFTMPYGNAVMITGRWGADNYGAIYIDANSNNPISTIPTGNGSGYAGWQPITFSGYLAAGTHRVTCVVTNPDAPDPTGLRVELSGFTTCVPLGVAVGSTVMQTGTTSSVPVNLLTPVDLSNLSFTLGYPGDRFTNWFVAASNGAIGTATVQDLDSTHSLVNFGAVPGQGIQGPALIGSIYFAALPGQSAFVPLEVAGVTGTNLDGTAAGDTFGQGGRVVVIGAQPLLEAGIGSNSTEILTLFGNPGTNYEILFSTNLLYTNWQSGWSVTLTNSNLFESFPLNPTTPQIFYRAN